jgi:SNF2 family DNA or RNA helicase
VCVFLLSLRAGAAGLTLTAASRVFLLEPSLDPAVEQQAVARVHRIGQKAEVLITRLLVADTVEEEVRA